MGLRHRNKRRQTPKSKRNKRVPKVEHDTVPRYHKKARLTKRQQPVTCAVCAGTFKRGETTGSIYRYDKVNYHIRTCMECTK